ncbi:MAG: threonine/serine dehydratase [Chloroflexi bacterium]|nr:threonine/serine dehydratase [Chloroflexota bacterium]MBM3154007.1 threonine/serine dehydratase [Chloroflexota bacterium]MBM3172765.1 threonine/serine dehydratase [Chloroflexota bacterium]MBM3174909.1 threonine/serine dehydratase [Chloroflexota bacterium]MBM4449688.1 threonine/serine dehydratase [Chloroflexota bacterium]
MIEIFDIKHAVENISGFVHRTPLLSSQTINSFTGKTIWFKAECFQKTGSFKVRGAANKIKPLAGKIGGVITISSGNHGQATAYVAGKVGLPAVIMVPEGTSQPKIDAAKYYGAEVIIGGDLNNIDPLIERAFALAAERKLEPVHPFDDAAIVAGQGTVGLEIVEDLPEVDIVVVPVGGGGLLSGVAVAIKSLCPSARVYGVGPVNASSMYESFRTGKMVNLHEMPQTIADGIRTPLVGQLTLEHTLKYVDDVVTVSDGEIIDALKLVWSRLKVFAEPSGASSLAAIQSGKLPIGSSQRVVAILSGGNVDLSKLSKLLK